MPAEDYMRLKTAGKKDFWRRNPLRGEIEIRLPRLKPFKMFCDNDDSVVKDLYWTDFRGWEPTSLNLWSKLAQDVGKACVLDVGCYSGIYALIAGAVSPGANVIAFDIQARCVARLEANKSLNGLGNVEVMHAACSSQTSEVEFYFYEEEGILSSVASLTPKAMNDKSARVASVRLDDIIKQRDVSVRLVKIDVEDAELEVIAGMTQILSEHRPDVLIEINSDANIRKIRRSLPRGYGMYSIDEATPALKRAGIWFKRFAGSRNFLLTTKSPSEISQLL